MNLKKVDIYQPPYNDSDEVFEDLNFESSNSSKILNLHSYQSAAVEWAFKKFILSKDYLNWFLVKAPTGSGKTLIGLAFLAKAFNEGHDLKLYYLTYTRIAKKQTESMLKKMQSSGLIDSKVVIVVECMQKNLKYKIENNAVVVFDEAHHIRKDGSFRAHLYKNKNIKFLLGLTGTPRKSFPDDGFIKCFLIKKEFCTRKFPEIIRIPIKFRPDVLNQSLNIGIDHISKSNSIDELCTKLEKKSKTNSSIQNTKYLRLIAMELYRQRKLIKKAIVFTEYREDALLLSEFLNEEFNKGVAFPLISGIKDFLSENGMMKIEEYLNCYRADDSIVQFIVGCDIISEAFDMPNVNSLVLTKNTSSDILYSQWVGRGSREYEGKEKTYIFDFRSNFDNYNSKVSRDDHFFEGCDFKDNGGYNSSGKYEIYDPLQNFDFSKIDSIVCEFHDWMGVDAKNYIEQALNNEFSIDQTDVENFLLMMCYKNTSAFFRELSFSDEDLRCRICEMKKIIEDGDELLADDKINTSKTKPLEVNFVKQVVAPMLMKIYEPIRVEYFNEQDSSRCDMVILASPRTIIEFDMGDASKIINNKTKLDKINNYHVQLSETHPCAEYENIIIGCTFFDESLGRPSSRSRKLDSIYNVYFLNWLDFFFLYGKRKISMKSLFDLQKAEQDKKLTKAA